MQHKTLCNIIAFLTILLCLGNSFLIARPTIDDYTLKTVVIDAGHGGKDHGCSGSIHNEKEIALKIALKLGNYIEENFNDVNVIYTRKTDVFVELHERAEIANSNNADLFISIHCNATSKSHVHGTETFVMGSHKTKENLDVAKRENSVILEEDNYSGYYDGFDPNQEDAHIVFELFQNSYREQSIIFAEYIEDQFKNRVGRFSRGVKEAGFLVLYKTTMPSVLIECGFLTNTNEEKFLHSDNGQSYIASAIYRAFKEFKKDIDDKIISSGTNNTQSQNTISEPINIVEQDVKEEGVFYRVQLYDSYQSMELTEPNFEKIGTIEIEADDSGIKYYLTMDNFDTKSIATSKAEQAKSWGFKNAKVVKYKEDKRVE